MIQKTILRCTLCHSTDVTCKAHVKPNSNNEFVRYSADEDDIQNCCYCNRCETHVSLEEVGQEKNKKPHQIPGLVYAIDAANPFCVFTDDTDGQWTWIADYSDPEEYTELDLIFRCLIGDIERQNIPYKYRHLTDIELGTVYQIRFQSMFGKAMQEIGKAVEEGRIKITPQFDKKYNG